MNTPPGFDLAPYHANLVAEIAQHFGSDVSVVAAYPCFDQKIPRTAVTVELDGITPDDVDDYGTGQFHGNIRFAAYVFVSYLDENPEKRVRTLGARLMAFIYGRRFGCPVGPAKIISAQPDALTLPGSTSKEAADYEVWRVEWSHEAFFGESVWTIGEGDFPAEVWTTEEGRIE